MTDIPASEFDRLVDILAEQAATALVDPKQYFRDLVARATLPRNLEFQVAGTMTGDPQVDARRLLMWAAARDVNPRSPGRTVLGSLLDALLRDLGVRDASEVVAIIVSRGLFPGREDRDRLIIGHQVPAPLASLRGLDAAGPDIDWLGPEDTVDLQAFLKPEPELLDVGFLTEAVHRAASVCRVERPEGEGVGTGFLVGPDLVLTNLHVMRGHGDEDPSASTARTVVRFGALGSGQRGETERIIKLAQNDPVVAFSPVDSLDFALIRVSEGVQGTTGAMPLLLEPGARAEKGDGLHILQHPNGGPMMLGVSENGISGVYPDQKRVQYVTRAAGGSSGSPCFNDDWQVVALHRAERSKPFGSIREGVMLRFIYEEIRQHL